MMLKPLYSLAWLLILVLLLTTACGRGPQCRRDTDCAQAGVCSESFCDQGICKSTKIDECCGNDICEALESKCTCPEDCGKCDRRISFIDDNGETIEARYLRMQCTEFEVCELTYRKEEQSHNDEFHEISLNDIVFNVIVRYSNPLATNRDLIFVELEIVEVSDPRIIYPITITNALVLDGALLFGQNTDRHSFASLDDRVEISIPIIRAGTLPEETHNLTVRLSLQYNYLDEKQVIRDGILEYDTYGRPILQRVDDKVVNAILEVNLEQSLTVMDITAGMLRESAWRNGYRERLTKVALP